TANMYAATCGRMKRGRVCQDRECTFPERCPNLRLDCDHQLAVLSAIRRLPGVERVSIGTGIRFDLLEGDADDRYLVELCRHYVSGQMRVAPEHVAARVLAAMRKCAPGTYLSFRRRFLSAGRRSKTTGRRSPLYLIPYFISGHPGADADDAMALAEHIVNVERFAIRQVQQFTPLPMTAASVMWHTGIDPFSGSPVRVPRSDDEQRLQRALLQPFDPDNLDLAERLLVKLKRRGLVPRLRALKRHLSGRPVRP
ncbi:DUF3362 domain-containing protein, partial [candidate division WOR-3 bacterium]|nr:DUF3362 domain-containing protein [candidate division WOR-3 bacterium]